MVITCFADEVQQTFHFNLEEAEMLLSDRARRNEKFTAADYVFLGRVGWDQKKSHDQLQRVSQALSHKAVAGSVADRAAALLEAETSAEIFEKEQPKIREKLEKLHKQLDGLERDARLSQKRVEQQTASVLKCREFAPSYVRQSVDAPKQILNTEGVGATLRQVTARIHELTCILNIDNVYGSPARHLEYGLKHLCPVAVNTVTQGRMLSYAYSDQWAGLKAAAELEFDELNSTIPELQSAYDAELSEIELALDFYSNPPSND